MIAFCFCDGTRQPLGILTVFVFLASSGKLPCGIISLCRSIEGFGYGSGYIVNFADVAPAYSSILFGLSITFGSLGSLGANVIAGIIITEPILDHWRRLFILFAIVYIIGGVVYVLFGSAVPQNLNQPKPQEPLNESVQDDER